MKNIDTIITTYNIRMDETLNSLWFTIRDEIWKNIETYGAGINDYGHDTLAPHLSRIAQDSKDFLLYLGQPEHVAHNFYDAIKISDLGKTHEEFDITIWKLPDKPTKDQRIEKRLHTLRGPKVLAKSLYNAPEALLKHPHIQTVIPVHMMHHHCAYEDDKDMGLMMEIACLIDAYDGDMDEDKITHRASGVRTHDVQYKRMLGKDPDDKYQGIFREELVHQYFDFREKHR